MEVTHEGIRAFEAAVWQGHMLDVLGRREQALEAYGKALELDVGKRVGWTIKVDRAWVEDRLEEPFTRR